MEAAILGEEAVPVGVILDPARYAPPPPDPAVGARSRAHAGADPPAATCPMPEWWWIQDGGGVARLNIGPVWAGVGLNCFIFYYFNLIYRGRQSNRLCMSWINRDL